MHTHLILFNDSQIKSTNTHTVKKKTKSIKITHTVKRKTKSTKLHTQLKGKLKAQNYTHSQKEN